MATGNDFWLRFNYWVLSNSSLLKKWWVIVLLGVTVFLVVFALTNMMVYIISYPREQRIIQAMVGSSFLYENQRETITPLALVFDTPVVIQGTGGVDDIIVRVENPNTQWMAESFTYVFTADGEEAGEGTGLLLPESDTYVAVFGEKLPEITDRARTVTVDVTDVRWQRFPEHMQNVGDIFSISNTSYRVSPGSTRIGSVTADITNVTLTGYWSTQFTVVLFAGDSPVGVNTVYLDKFERDSTRTMSIQWSPAPPRVDRVRIIPELNLLDTLNIMKP
ncbi:hypothetical protein ACFL0L_03025 [Patescibacteria group bacterium]